MRLTKFFNLDMTIHQAAQQISELLPKNIFFAVDKDEFRPDITTEVMQGNYISHGVLCNIILKFEILGYGALTFKELIDKYPLNDEQISEKELSCGNHLVFERFIPEIILEEIYKKYSEMPQIEILRNIFETTDFSYYFAPDSPYLKTEATKVFAIRVKFVLSEHCKTLRKEIASKKIGFILLDGQGQFWQEYKCRHCQCKVSFPISQERIDELHNMGYLELLRKG